MPTLLDPPVWDSEPASPGPAPLDAAPPAATRAPSAHEIAAHVAAQLERGRPLAGVLQDREVRGRLDGSGRALAVRRDG